MNATEKKAVPDAAPCAARQFSLRRSRARQHPLTTPGPVISLPDSNEMGTHLKKELPLGSSFNICAYLVRKAYQIFLVGFESRPSVVTQQWLRRDHFPNEPAFDPSSPRGRRAATERGIVRNRSYRGTGFPKPRPHSRTDEPQWRNAHTL